MRSYAIEAPLIYDGKITHHNSTLIVQDGIIKSIEPTITPNNDNYHIFSYDDGIIVPGFIDLQANGGGGLLFNNSPTVEGLKNILSAHKKLGTHALLPTLITTDDITLLQAIDAVKRGIDQEIEGLLGIHLEGPMINEEKRGIHASGFIHILDRTILNKIYHDSLGKILITLAPETVPTSLISELSDAGVTIFAGHTAASPDQLYRAFEAGLSGFTHLYNAMPPMTSRSPSVVGTALTHSSSWCSIINDGIHVHPSMVKIAIQCKTPQKTILVTDSMATLGSDLSSFEYNGQTISLDTNSSQLLNHEGKLAGAYLNLFTAVKNTIALGYSFEEAINMVTINPARALKIENQFGHLQIGAKAYINHISQNAISSITFF